MPDEPENPQNIPGRHRPQLSELSKETTEEDLWDLEGEFFDDEATPESVAQPEAPSEEKTEDSLEPKESRKSEKSKEAPPSKGSASQTQPKDSAKSASSESSSIRSPRSVDPKTRPKPPKASRQIGPRPMDPKSMGATPEPEPAPSGSTPTPKEEEDSLPEAESKPHSNPGTTTDTPSESKDTRKSEKLGLVILGVVFLGLAIWWVSSLFSSIPTTRLGDDQPDFPIEGRFSKVTTAETYWREPRRDGDQADKARSEVVFIPVLSVTLDDSQTGVLRAIYRDEENNFVGDSISQSFALGMFDSSGNPTVEFPATDGFQTSGDFNGYRVGDKRWTVEVFEGPSSDAPGSEFKLLFSSPISTNRQ
ncbi:hypothetical protein [Haloferula sp.]|uniref:hypothetical protein n=1 Tax=Haloferula sp. TaxID=2497595 RepID=UPI003C7253EC